MQLLGPLEKERLREERSTFSPKYGCGRDGSELRTGFHRPRLAIRVFHSCWTTFPVGIHRHLGPKVLIPAKGTTGLNLLDFHDDLDNEDERTDRIQQ